MAEDHLSALAALLVEERNAWPEALAQMVALAGAEVGVCLGDGNPPLRLASFGALPPSVFTVGEEPELRQTLERAGFVSVWSRAFWKAGGRTGIVALGSRERAALDDAARARLDALAPILALDLNARALAAAREADLHSRRHLEARLGDIERQSTVGAVASAVAHDLAAPISALLMELGEVRDRVAYLGTLLPKPGPILHNVLEDLRGLAGHCTEAAERARHLLIDFRLAAHPRAESPAAQIAVDVGDALRSCVRLVTPLARDKVRIDLVVDPDLPRIPGARRRLEQAFTNLLVNAVHAASVREGFAGRVSAEARRDGEDIVVEVRDNGPGIAPEVKARLFEPFFTTKAPGVGTGLGLPLARDAVEGHGGRLEVESSRGQGACFRARLPIASLPAHAAPTHLRKRVLVVDTDDGVARALSRVLRGDYEVTIAHAGHEMLELIDAGARFDAMIVDVSLRDVSGPELFARVRERWPGLEKKMVFATGGAFSPASRQFLASVPNSRFEKSISGEELRPILQRVVSAA